MDDFEGVDVHEGIQLVLFGEPKRCAGPGCSEIIPGHLAYCSRRCVKAVYMQRHGDRINAERRERERVRYANDPEWRALRLQRETARYRADAERFKSRARERLAENGDEIRARDRERYAADPTKKRAAALNWAAANPDATRALRYVRRARLANAETFKVTARDLRHLRHRQRGVCFYCDARPDRLTIEHLIPLSRGGRDSIGNYVLACHSCNAAKGARLVMEFRLGRRRVHGGRHAEAVRAVQRGDSAAVGASETAPVLCDMPAAAEQGQGDRDGAALAASAR